MRFVSTMVKFTSKSATEKGYSEIQASNNTWMQQAFTIVTDVFDKEKLFREPLYESNEGKHEAFFCIYNATFISKLLVDFVRPIALGRMYDTPAANIAKVIAQMNCMLLFARRTADLMTDKHYSEWMEAVSVTGGDEYNEATVCYAFVRAEVGVINDDFVDISKQERLSQLADVLWTRSDTSYTVSDGLTKIKYSEPVVHVEGKSCSFNQKMFRNKNVKGLSQLTVSVLPILSYAPSGIGLHVTETSFSVVKMKKHIAKRRNGVLVPVIKRDITTFPMFSMDLRFENNTQNADSTSTSLLYLNPDEADPTRQGYLTDLTDGEKEKWNDQEVEVRNIVFSAFMAVEEMAYSLRRYGSEKKRTQLSKNYKEAKRRILQRSFNRQTLDQHPYGDLTVIPRNAVQRKGWEDNYMEKKKYFFSPMCENRCGVGADARKEIKNWNGAVRKRRREIGVNEKKNVMSDENSDDETDEDGYCWVCEHKAPHFGGRPPTAQDIGTAAIVVDDDDPAPRSPPYPPPGRDRKGDDSGKKSDNNRDNTLPGTSKGRFPNNISILFIAACICAFL
jgi:hypothetical protein